MSPTYYALRDGNQVTIPTNYLSSDYQLPAFHVRGPSNEKPASRSNLHEEPERSYICKIVGITSSIASISVAMALPIDLNLAGGVYTIMVDALIGTSS
jgi:hypothetical protein